MFLLAQRNLFHDKIRLAATLAGVSFAVVLIVVELGLYFGFTRAVSSLIDNSQADLWVTVRGCQLPGIGNALSPGQTLPGYERARGCRRSGIHPPQ